jgi:hypothetical protein
MRINFYAFKFLVFAAVLVCLSSCVSLPKLSSLEPMPEYPKDPGSWDTSAKCVVVSENETVPVADFKAILNEAGYTICDEPLGYLTRKIRLGVDKAIVIEAYTAENRLFQDGSCIDASITVSIHDTQSIQGYGPFSAQARSITKEVDLRDVSGGKDLLEEIKRDESRVSQVPELIGEDSEKVSAYVKDGDVYITDGNVFPIVMKNLLSQPDTRKALSKES